eukprot:scaffold9756_cov139-Skeletonema_menzelii.AAC.10
MLIFDTSCSFLPGQCSCHLPLQSEEGSELHRSDFLTTFTCRHFSPKFKYLCVGFEFKQHDKKGERTKISNIRPTIRAALFLLYYWASSRDVFLA